MFGLLKNLFSSEPDTFLVQAIQDGALLVDVRTPSEFASGSVKGAVNPWIQCPINWLNLKDVKVWWYFVEVAPAVHRLKGFWISKVFPMFLMEVPGIMFSNC
jgi:rhodanese-related sulfurtransferase